MIRRFIYILCAPNGKEEWIVDLYIYCVPLMEKRMWLLDLYLLCVPHGKEEWLVNLHMYCVPLMEKSSGS